MNFIKNLSLKRNWKNPSTAMKEFQNSATSFLTGDAGTVATTMFLSIMRLIINTKEIMKTGLSVKNARRKALFFIN